MRFVNASRTAATIIFCLSTMPGRAGAIHDSELFTTFSLGATDDGSSSAVNLGFSALIANTSYCELYVNNNGNVTFGHPISDYAPSALIDGNELIIAPFWADVDTTGNGSGLTTYGTGMINGQKVFGVNWTNVGYYSAETDKLNSFQLIITDRSNIARGAFDVQFNYDSVAWESGNASGGHSGLGGTSAAAGYSFDPTHTYRLPGSFANGALLDSGTNALISHSRSSDIPGQYNFHVRGGTVVAAVPEPKTYALITMGLAVLGFVLPRRNKANSAKYS